MSRFWIRYAGWALVGASGLLSLVAGFSFGLFLLPVFLVSLVVMLMTRREGDGSPPQYPGLFAGFVAIGLLLEMLNGQWWQLIPINIALICLAVGLPLWSMRDPARSTFE